jgi:hypothetical protein
MIKQQPFTTVLANASNNGFILHPLHDIRALHDHTEKLPLESCINDSFTTSLF